MPVAQIGETQAVRHPGRRACRLRHRARRHRLRREGRTRLRLRDLPARCGDVAQGRSLLRPPPQRIDERRVHGRPPTPADGTLTVTDKRTGRTYAGLNRFVDGGDKGDEYNYCVPETETVVDRPVRAAEDPRRVARARRAAADDRDDVHAAVGARRRPHVAQRRRRSSERIVTTVTLTDGVPRIDVRTVVFNAAEDHRLRVHFPSGIKTDVSKARPALRRRPAADRAAGVGSGDVDGRADGHVPAEGVRHRSTTASTA